jgi:hypothetical protein
MRLQRGAAAVPPARASRCMMSPQKTRRARSSTSSSKETSSCRSCSYPVAAVLFRSLDAELRRCWAFRLSRRADSNCRPAVYEFVLSGTREFICFRIRTRLYRSMPDRPSRLGSDLGTGSPPRGRSSGANGALPTRGLPRDLRRKLVVRGAAERDNVLAAAGGSWRAPYAMLCKESQRVRRTSCARRFVPVGLRLTQH